MGEYFFSLAKQGGGDLKKIENQQYSTQCSAQINSLRLQNEVTQGDLLQSGMVAHT